MKCSGPDLTLQYISISLGTEKKDRKEEVAEGIQ